MKLVDILAGVHLPCRSTRDVKIAVPCREGERGIRQELDAKQKDMQPV